MTAGRRDGPCRPAIEAEPMPMHPSQTFGLFLLRLTFGGLMALGHGWPKLMLLISNPEDLPFPDPLGIGAKASLVGAVVGELVAGVLVAVGLFTRPAAAVIAATMFVAGFVHHAGSPWFLPAEDAREPALLYLLGALCIVIMGPGKLSLDQRFFGEKKRRF